MSSNTDGVSLWYGCITYHVCTQLYLINSEFKFCEKYIFYSRAQIYLNSSFAKMTVERIPLPEHANDPDVPWFALCMGIISSFLVGMIVLIIVAALSCYGIIDASSCYT